MHINKLLKQDYNNNGYAIIRSVIKPDLVDQVQKHVEWLQNKYPKITSRISPAIIPNTILNARGIDS